jgi:hypothetical protein
MGGEGRQEQLALGEVPNIASRIEGLAAPNTITISAATYRLVEGFFDCQALGEHTLRGVSQPLNVYRVLGESGVHSRLDIASARGLTPLVGRESEVTLLLERWEQVKAGQGQVILLTGDAGVGKSRLVQMPDFSVVLFRPNFILASEGYPMKVHKNQWLLTMPSPPAIPCGAAIPAEPASPVFAGLAALAFRKP